jgi:PAS domain S-box-containing protein
MRKGKMMKDKETARKATGRGRYTVNKASIKKSPSVTAAGKTARLQDDLDIFHAELAAQGGHLLEANAELHRYFELFDLAPIGFFALDANLNIVQINMAGAELLGSDRARLSGMKFDKYIAAGCQDGFRRCLTAAATTGARQTCGTRIRRLTGTEFAAELHIGVMPGELQRYLVVATDMTERNKAEARYRTMLDTTQAGYWYFDLNGKILEANAAYCRMSGYTQAELAGMHVWDFEANEGREDVLRHIHYARRHKQDEFESRHRRKDGSLFDVEIRTTYLDVEGGRLVAFIRDITGRKRAEEARDASEKHAREQSERLQAVLDAAPAIIWIALDRECSNIVGNREAYRFLRVAMGDDLSKTGPAPERLAHYRVFRDGIELAPHEMPMQQVAASGKPLVDYALDFIFDDKTVRSLVGNVTPRLDSNGQPNGAIAAFIDITDLKKAELTVRENEERYRTLFQGMTEGFAVHEIICDEAGKPYDYRFLEINPAFEKLTGLKRQDVEGKRLSEVLPGDDPIWPQIYGDVALTGKSVRFENYSPVLKKHFEVFAYSPAPGRFAVLFIDITERKQMEQLKEEFIGMVSHEMRTPLTVIIGAIDTALSAGISVDDARALLHDAQSSAEDLANILENLLELSRHQSNRLFIHKVPVDIARAARTAAEKIQLNYSHSIFLDIPDGFPRVPADELRVGRILHNLLENAVKYSPVGTRIRISARQESGDVVIGVSDLGPGISAADRGRIFQQFERLDEPARAKGLGLGLVVCKRLVEAHGGTIWVESEPGHGATFYFKLPLTSETQGAGL